MIDLVIIVSSLSFILEIGIGVSGDHMHHAMGGEIVVLLWRFA
jgi:hypothetical protein